MAADDYPSITGEMREPLLSLVKKLHISDYGCRFKRSMQHHMV